MPQRKLLRFLKWSAAIVALVGVAAVVAIEVFHVGTVAVPEYKPVAAKPLSQNWAPGWGVGQTQWFHHASQGTRLLRLEWFVALEQPEISVFSTPGLFHESSYLERFGFLSSEKDPAYNPHGLPIGFAVEKAFQEPFKTGPVETDPYSEPPYAVVGLTCAACHTSQINYQGRGVRIDGGSAMIDLNLLQDAVGRALYYTKLFPMRFDRFARRVLGEGYGEGAKNKLKADLVKYVDQRLADLKYAESQHLTPLKGGPGRTDAIGLIGNRAFKDLNPENQSITDAPVNFPPLWDTSWFYWVQYNNSIRLPMVRNIGEATGVGGMVNTDHARGRMFDSTVNVRNLHLMEKQLAGDGPFRGLAAPKWPETVDGKPFLPAIDRALAERGRALFAGERYRCIGCHSTVEKLQAELASFSAESPGGTGFGNPRDPPPHWIQDYFQRRPVIALPTVSLERIGTDPGQAVNFQRRVVSAGDARLTLGEALDKLTRGIRELKYAELGLTKEEILEYDGNRIQLSAGDLANAQVKVGDADISPRRRHELQLTGNLSVRAPLGYKARPLNGIWATAPYLHNGSVPNLHELLGPPEDRSARFYSGSREFDPEKVGFRTTPFTYGFEVDTSLPGNRNTGHVFRDLAENEGTLVAERPDDPTSKNVRWVKGVIGPAISPDDRRALIEYLKTL